MHKATDTLTMRRLSAGPCAWLLVVMLVSLSGCGGSSKSATTQPPDERNVVWLVPDQALAIQPGDELVPEGDAEIRVRHDLATDTKHVTLLSGSAYLLRF